MPQTTLDRTTARRRAVTAVAARELVADVARRLAGEGIAVMPLKGALLQHWLYKDPIERPLTDVDLLVHPETLQQAVRLLEPAGYQKTKHATVGGMVMETPFGLMLDLHSQLFDRARYRMTTAELFSRSTKDSEMFGVSVRLPAPLDVYAHLIGKFGSDHLDRRAAARLDEIAKMGERLDCEADLAGRHLVRCGLRRVSRYVLPLVQQATGDVFAKRVHESLPPDPIGRGIAALAGPLLSGASERSRLGAVMAHLMNDSVPRGVRSGVRGIVQQVLR